MFSMFKICCWYNPGEDDQNTAENISIRCINCGKETIISMDKMNNTCQDIITSFVLNIMLQHVGMLWIIETHEQLKYDMNKNHSDWMIGGPWYKKPICKKLYGNMFEEFIINTKSDRYNIMCSIDAHEKLNPS